MEFFTVVLLCLKILSAFSYDCKKLSHFACAFVNITKSLTQSSKQVNIYNRGNNRKMLDSIILKDSENLSFAYNIQEFTLVHYNIVLPRGEIYETIKYELKEPGIMLLDSAKTLEVVNRFLSYGNVGPKHYRFYVYIPNLTTTQIMKHSLENLNFRYFDPYARHDKRDTIHFQYFLVDEGDFLKLYTLTWFSPHACRKKKLLEVNRFDKKNRKWKHESFSTRKFDNFYGCQLNFLYKANTTVLDIYDQMAFPMEFNYDIIIELSKSLNFEANFITISKFITYTEFSKNQSQLIDMEVISECLPLNYKTSRVFVSHLYYSAAHYFAVPPGEEYSGYEKLTFPFDFHTWTLITFTFVVAFMTIFIVSFASEKIKNFVFGRNIASPSTNVLAHFFGLGQMVLPRRNFSRFLLMVFILYCLIIRSAWLGKMFEFLQKEMRKPQVESIDEMIEDNFTFFLPFSYKFYNQSKRLPEK
jgi:hypothetical protein